MAGSCAEYAPSDAPLTEESPIAPWSVYGAAKASLHLLLDSSMGADLEVVWARIFNLTGPGEHPDRLFPWVLHEVAAGRPVALTSGRQQRDFLDVADVARAVATLGAGGVTGTFNISSGQGHALRDLIEQLVPPGSGRELLDFGARPHGEHDPMTMIGDNRRLVECTDWRPRYTIDEVLARVERGGAGG